MTTWSQLFLYCVTEYMRDSDEKYPWLSEFICEYVDDTMDPDARAMFEEYLQADSSLQHYVGSLRTTRRMLQHHGCRLHAPCSLQQQLRARIAMEQELEVPTLEEAPSRDSSIPLLLMALIAVSLLGTGAFLSGYSHTPHQTSSVLAEATWSPVIHRIPETRPPRVSQGAFARTVSLHDSISTALMPRFYGEP